MKNKLLIMITVVLLIDSNSWAKEKKEEIDYPSFYSTITIGAIEGFSFSLGKYLTDDLAVAVKWSLFGLKGSGFGPNAAWGIGFGVNYFFKKLLIFQYISADYIIINNDGFEGYGLEATIGNCTNRERGFGFIYEFGIGYSDTIAEFTVPQYQRLILLGPIIKIGLNYNL